MSNVSENVQNVVNTSSTVATQVIQEQKVKYKDAYQDAYGVLDQMLIDLWDRIPYILIAIAVIVLAWLLSKFFKYSIKKALGNSTPQRRNLIIVLARLGHIAILFIGILIALMVVIPSFTPAQAISGLGIGSVAIGFAFKDIFQNFLSGILILLGEPFKVGDYIQVNGMEGTVEDIQIRATYLRSLDGRRLIIPNATVYTSPVTVNTAYPERRCEFIVGISYDDDIQKAKTLVVDLLQHHQHVLKTPTFDVFVSSLADFSVNITVRWWIDTQQTSIFQSVGEIQHLVKERFQQEGIEIPYPIQQTIHTTPLAVTAEKEKKQLIDEHH